MDVAHPDAAERELVRMIEKRSLNGEVDPDTQEELWQMSLRRYHEEHRLQARLACHAYHCGQAERHRRTLEDLIGHHEEQARKLVENADRGEGAE